MHRIKYNKKLVQETNNSEEAKDIYNYYISLAEGENDLVEWYENNELFNDNTPPDEYADHVNNKLDFNN